MSGKRFLNSKTEWKTGLSSVLLRYEKLVMVLLASAGLTAVLQHVEFNLLEANLYDLRVKASFPARSSNDIILVTLDDQTIKALDQPAPLSIDTHARFMEALERLHPRGIGYLIDFNQVRHTNTDLFQSPWTERFLNATRHLEQSGTTVLFGTPYDVTGEVVAPYPLSTLPHALAFIHKDGTVFAEDKVTRRALVSLNDKPTFHIDFAERLGMIPTGQVPQGTFSIPEIGTQYFFFRYRGDTVIPTRQRATPPYERISFHEFLDGNFPADALRGKILLVSTFLRESPSDFTYTPYSRTEFVNPKLLVHAHILDSVIHDDGIIILPVWINWVVTFVMSSLVFWWVLNLTPLYGVFSTISLSIAFLVVSQVLFQTNGLWVRESQPLVAILIGYYLAVPYRLIREYKKRWDYQRKNELLIQVEELKTNFLNLVTHDLKTPVARIQGLAEVLLRKASDRLIDRDRETVQHIISSTDELNRFISSILELSKVESQRLRLQIESKDINQLIERCVEGFKAPARARQIKIQLQLEPLFPVRIDAGLISKVMNNLVDNAIKYSPVESEIQIISREVDNWIEILIQDSGIGMTPEEQENLFTRFYRAKNDTTAEISGTGLGLYLTRYFIEAHGGSVEVESEKGKGSTFKIRLPIEGAKSDSIMELREVKSYAKVEFNETRVMGLTRKITTLVKNLSNKS